jgi:ribose transport system substrate-binding protein
MNVRKILVASGLMAAALSLGAVALAQEEDIVVAQSTDYLNDTSIANPIGEVVETLQFQKEPPYTIGFINWSTANSWTVQIVEEVRDEATLYPQIEEFIIVSSEGDADTQISQIEDMIVRGVDALLLIPVSPDAIVPAVEEAAAEGIPVVVFAADVNTDAYVTKLLANPVLFGRAQGDWLMNELECQGNIIVLNGVTGISTSDLRRQGLQDAIEACPDGGEGITILAEEDAAWAYDQGRLATERMLAAYPEIDGVWSQGGAMTQGAIDAFEAAGRELVPMTGEDNNGFLLAWQERLDDGFRAMSASEPTWQSRVALQAALRILQGLEVNSYYELQVPVIFEDTVDQYVRPEYSDAYWANSRLSEEAADALYLLEEASS